MFPFPGRYSSKRTISWRTRRPGSSRLAPDREIRLKDAYYITCVDVVKDPDSGKVVEVHCTYDPETKGGTSQDRRRVRGTSHWVSAAHCLDAEVRIYDHLFLNPGPAKTRKSQIPCCL